MMTYKVRLNSIDKVKSFVDSIKSFEGTALITHNGLAVDAHSILGIFSMNLTDVLDLKLDSDTLPKQLIPFLA